MLEYPLHQGLQRLVQDLNRLYRDAPALHRCEFDWQGFEWIDCHDSQQSVLCFMRRAGEAFVVVVVNLTPVPRHGYRIGVPRPGRYQEMLNTDAAVYGGSNLGNGGPGPGGRGPSLDEPALVPGTHLATPGGPGAAAGMKRRTGLHGIRGLPTDPGKAPPRWRAGGRRYGGNPVQKVARAVPAAPGPGQV